MKSEILKGQNLFKVIAIYEVVSGVFGFWFVLLQAISATNASTQQDLVFLLCSVMSVAMLISGMMLFRLQAIGYHASLVLQVLQVFGFRWGQSFVFGLGTWFAIGFDANKSFLFYEFSLMAVNFAVGETNKSLVYVSIVPVVVVLQLFINRHVFFRKTKEIGMGQKYS
jgi:hypothetical protein